MWQRNQSKYYCLVCKNTISDKEYDYSRDIYGGALCFHDQQRLRFPLQKATYEAKRLYFALLERDINAQIEKFDGFKHIDIAIPDAKVNIEVDGAHHNFSYEQAMSDLQRTLYSFKKGYLTLRIPNSLVQNNLENTARYIERFVNESLEQLYDWG